MTNGTTMKDNASEEEFIEKVRETHNNALNGEKRLLATMIVNVYAKQEYEDHPNEAISMRVFRDLTDIELLTAGNEPGVELANLVAMRYSMEAEPDAAKFFATQLLMEGIKEHLGEHKEETEVEESQPKKAETIH